MNLQHFKEALLFIEKWEGGYVNHPNDPGGATNRGITQRTYDDWRATRGRPSRDVRELSREEEILIYYENYWAAAGCSELEYPFNVAHFDTAVNCGVHRAVDWLKKAKDVDDYLLLREKHYINLARQDRFRVFFRGWMNRLRDLQKLVEIGEERERAG